MFYDERIQKELGKSFRAVIGLSSIISIIYGVLHLLAMREHGGTIRVLGLLFELIGIVAGMIVLLYGEIKFSASGRDERLASGKYNYYKKIFYPYLGVILFACYLQSFLSSADEWFAPSHFLSALQLPCWLLLLICLKYHGVPFNYSYMAEDRCTYIQRTFANVSKLGKFVLLATAGGLCVSLVFGASFLQLIAVLLSGVVSWVSLSVEYLLISWAERVSDRANEQQRMSSASKIFGCFGVVLYLISAGISIYWSWDNGSNITDGKKLMIVTTFSQLFERLGIYAFGLFTVYVYNELKPIKSRWFDRAVITAMGVFIFTFIFESIKQVINYLIDGMDSQIKLKISLKVLYAFVAIKYLTMFLGTLALVVMFVLIAKNRRQKKDTPVV